MNGYDTERLAPTGALPGAYQTPEPAQALDAAPATESSATQPTDTADRSAECTRSGYLNWPCL